MYLRLALLNTFRNKRRALLNILMIAGGVTGIILFEGFSHHVLGLMRDVSTKSNYGHMQVAKKSFWNKSSDDSAENLISDGDRIVAELRKLPGVLSVSGRISFFGLLGNGERTVGASAFSIDPVAEPEVLKSYKIVDGRTLTAEDAATTNILMGAGLARALKVKPGADLTIIAVTYDKVINAIDVQVQGMFETALVELDDTAFVLPVSAAQRLLDTKNVEKIVVRLHDTDRTDSVMTAVQDRISSDVGELLAKPWYVLDRLYWQVRDFYSIQNTIVATIIISLILLGILNTLSMSVFERTGEIGTMRSLGAKRRQVIAQFVLEGAVLTGFGIVAGTVCGIALATIINGLKLEVVLPNTSAPIFVHIDMVPKAFAVAWSLTFVAAIVASIIPAYRITKLRIVDALRYNI